MTTATSARKSYGRPLMAAVMLLLVAAGGGFVYTRMGAPVQVTVTPAAKGAVVGKVVATGPVRPSQETDVSSRISGVLLQFPLKEGDQVKKGQVIARIQRTPFITAVTEAESRLTAQESLLAQLQRKSRLTDDQATNRIAAAERKLELARSQLTDRQLAAGRALEAALFGVSKLQHQIRKLPDDPALKTEMGRAEQLVADARADQARLADPEHPARLQVTLAEVELKDARTAVEAGSVLPQELQSAGAAVSAARQAVEKAGEDLAATVITAPMDGIVLQTYMKEGAGLVPGAKLATLAAADQSVVVANVDESDIDRVMVGQPARVTSPAVAGLTAEGTVSRILPKATKDSSNATVISTEVEFANPGYRLRSSMNADVEIEVARKSDVIRVPVTVVKGKGNDRYLFVLESGVARRRTVTVGVRDVVWVEITEGLGEGDPVITGPEPVLRNLQDGRAVQAGGNGP